MPYNSMVQTWRQELSRKEDLTILALESSCDDTASAVVKNGRVILSADADSQIMEHRRYGGVVPEVAARSHLKSIDDVVDRALENAGVDFDEIDAIAVTCGPGLVGALLSGVSCAKALAFSRGIPLVGVHHIKGHIAASYLQRPDWEPPFIALVVSGVQTVLNGGLHVFLLGAEAGLNGLLRLRVVRRGLKRRLEQLFGIFVNGLHARGQAMMNMIM